VGHKAVRRDPAGARRPGPMTGKGPGADRAAMDARGRPLVEPNVRILAVPRMAPANGDHVRPVRYSVHQAPSSRRRRGPGHLGVRAAAAHPDRIHLLLTEVVMPGMNGRELAVPLRQQRPDMKVQDMSDCYILPASMKEDRQ
jgi:CheY-like chemotaxis protein